MYEITELLWRRRALVGAIAAGLALIGIAIVIVGRDTTYTARSQVILDQPQLLGNVSGVNVPGKLATMAPTLCRLLDGDDAVKRISEASGATADAVRSDLRCRPLEATTIVQLSATAGAAEPAQRIAQAAADVLANEVTTRYGGEAIPERERIVGQVLASARRPAKDPNHTARQLALVAFAALLAAAAFAVAAEPHRRDTMASPTETEPVAAPGR